MLINDLFESQQIDELDFNKIGRGIGRAVGGTAQAIGATAGGVAGIPGAVRRGYQAGKNIVGQGIPDTQQPAQQQPGASTGAASTLSTITNPETGKLYTKAELRTKYGATAQPTGKIKTAQPQGVVKKYGTMGPLDNPNPAAVAATPVPAQPAVAPTPTDVLNTKQAKKNIDATVAMINKLQPRSKKAVIKHAQDVLTKVSATPPTWTGRVTKSPKITAPAPAGAPTSAERANLDQKIQAALAKQPVAESLSWSKDFDPSRSLLKQIQRS